MVPQQPVDHSAELTSKISVLETNIHYLVEGQQETRTELKSLGDAVRSVQTNVDKWNGTIPSIAKNVEGVVSNLAELSSNVQNNMTKVDVQEEKLKSLSSVPDKLINLDKEFTALKAQTKLLWKITGAVAVVVLGVIAKILVGA